MGRLEPSDNWEGALVSSAVGTFHMKGDGSYNIH